ncbi:MAG: hydroxyacylglutathione hydrolase [Saprospiraceae bacterium]|jgi:hydroxyacylglutathione hydrolase
MKIEQIYTGCLAQGAYYIESNGEVAIVDPLRKVDGYIERATKDNAVVKYIFETHFHADFVSGHVTLSRLTGAPIIYGPLANPAFNAIIAEDGQEFQLGEVTIRVLHTPGHTMESTTYLLLDKDGIPHTIFSGDTLFLGDVGRPDLAQKAADLTQEELAGYLYHSLREKIMPLPDAVIVYPAHGAGSACGKNMMKETVDTLGNQKKVNYALREDMTEAEFIKEVTDGLLPPPAYFPLNVKMNKEGYEDFSAILSRSDHALNPKAFELLANETGAVILDVRSNYEFAKGHIPQSIFIGLDGDFAPWVGALIKDLSQSILLVVDEDRIEEAVTRLTRVGFDQTIGYLEGGIESWINDEKEIDIVDEIEANELARLYDDAHIIDVRKQSEYTSEHVLKADNFPLAEINNHLSRIPIIGKTYIHCAGGYRSMIAMSILKLRGYHDIVNVIGGYDKIKESSIPKSDFVCPSTL